MVARTRAHAVSGDVLGPEGWDVTGLAMVAGPGGDDDVILVSGALHPAGRLGDAPVAQLDRASHF